MNPNTLLVLFGLFAVFGSSNLASASPYKINGGEAKQVEWQQPHLEVKQKNNELSRASQPDGSQMSGSEYLDSMEEGSIGSTHHEESGSRYFEFGPDKELTTHEYNAQDDRTDSAAQKYLKESESDESEKYDSTKNAARIEDDVKTTLEEIRKNKEQNERNASSGDLSMKTRVKYQSKPNSLKGLHQPSSFSSVGSGNIFYPTNQRSGTSSFSELISTTTQIDGVKETVNAQESDNSASVSRTNDRGETQRSAVKDTTESESKITSILNENGLRETSTSQETAKTQSKNKSNTNSKGKIVTSGIQDTKRTASQSYTDGQINKQFVKAIEDTSKTTEQGKVKNFSSSQEIVQTPDQSLLSGLQKSGSLSKSDQNESQVSANAKSAGDYGSGDITRIGSAQGTTASSSTLKTSGENNSSQSSSNEEIESKSLQPSEAVISAITQATNSKFDHQETEKKGRYDLQKTTSDVERALETDIHLRTLIVRNDVDGGQCYCSCDNNSKPVFISLDGRRV